MRALVPCVLSVALALFSGTSPAWAGNPGQPASMAQIEGPAPGADGLEQAQETGDLSTALGLAQEARKQDPTPDTWTAEGEACAALADYACAKFAYGRAAQGLDADADAERIEELEARIGDLELASRGVAAGDGASSHREQFDASRAQRTATATPPGPDPGAAAQDPGEDTRIWRKWYFWVTVGTIVAGAAAVTVIAVKAAADDRPDALDRSGSGPRSIAPSGLGFHF